MKKFLFGIVAVASLQVGYMAYTAGERYLVAEVYPVAPAMTAPLQTASLPPVETVHTVDNIAIRPTRARHRAISQPVRPDKAVFKLRPRRIDSARPVIAAAKTPRLRTYERLSPMNTEVRAASIVEFDKSPHKNKSFLAKALPIIKKPYDWLKAVGSRLR